MVEQHSRPRQAAGRLCGTVSPPHSHSVLQTQLAFAVAASFQNKYDSFNKTWKQTEGAGLSGMQYTHRINLDKLGGVNVTKKKKKDKYKDRNEKYIESV